MSEAKTEVCRWCGKPKRSHYRTTWVRYCFDTNDSTTYEPAPAVTQTHDFGSTYEQIENRIGDAMDDTVDQIYVARIDRIPSLSTQPHEIADECSLEDVVKMWGALKKYAERLEHVLRGILDTEPLVNCNDFDHRKKDQHDGMTPCPALSRWTTAVEIARAALEQEVAR